MRRAFTFGVLCVSLGCNPAIAINSNGTSASPSAEARDTTAPAAHHAEPAPRPTFDVALKVHLRPGPAGKRAEMRRFWVYQPVPLPERVPLVLMAPAGTGMLAGRELSSDDREEHLSFVRAGFMVVAYSIDGNLKAGVAGEAATRALRDYKASRAGVENAKHAITLATELVPTIDSDRVFAVGRDFAGAHALLLAAEVPLVKAVAVLGPVTQLVGDVPAIMSIDRVIPGYAAFIRSSSPENRIHDVGVPVFIHQSTEDELIRPAQTTLYVKRLSEDNGDVHFVLEAAGSHMSAARDRGIPLAIEWLDER